MSLRLRHVVGTAGGLSGLLSLAFTIVGLGKRTPRGGRQRLWIRRHLDDVRLAQLPRAIDRLGEVEDEVDEFEDGVQEGAAMASSGECPDLWSLPFPVRFKTS